MKNPIRLSLIIVCLFCMLGTAGCWNRRELNDLAIVMGIGLDKPQQTSGNIQVTAELAKSGETKSAKKGESGGGSKGYYNAKNTGNTLFDTLRDFTHQLSRKLYFPHNEVLIFGHDIAKEGVQQYIEFFLRDHEPRVSVWVLVAKDTASEVFDETPEFEKMPAAEIAKIIKVQAATSQTSTVKLVDFITRLMSKTTAPIAPFIELSGEGTEKNVIVSGTAVFKKDKLVGQLNKMETRGLLWVINEIKSGIIDVDSPNDGGKVELEIIRAKSKITPEIIDDKIHIKIEIKEEGNIGSQTGLENLALPEKFALLEKEKSAAIESEVMAALKKARDLNADIFGFGDAVHQKYPAEWKDLEERWDEIFPDIEVELSIEAKLRRTGRISPPAVPVKE